MTHSVEKSKWKGEGEGEEEKHNQRWGAVTFVHGNDHKTQTLKLISQSSWM